MSASGAMKTARRVIAPNENAQRATRVLPLCDRRRATSLRPGGERGFRPHSQTALAKTLGSFTHLSPGELERLAEFQLTPEKLHAKTDLIHEGQGGHRAYILQRGWTYCYKLLADGRRQVVTFSVPGDFIGLRSILLRTSDQSVATLTDAVVSPIAVPRVIRVFREFPRLGAAILWAISREKAIAAEHLVSLGRRSAIARVAHFFLELGHRLQLVGLATETEFECPINQHLLADALGLTPIHVNRVLRQLREQGLLTVREQHVVIDDVRGLMGLAGYDSAYLDQPRPWAEMAS